MQTPLENQAFQEPFFRRFARKPHGFEAEGRRLEYAFPSFFRTRVALVALLCNRAKLQKLLADDRLQSVGMLAGRALVVFGCYEHLEVAEMRPYREAFVCVPCFVDASFRPPLLPVALGGRAFPSFGQVFLHMPVTSEDNRLRGVHLWGLPKTSGDISCDERNGRRECQVSTSEGSLFRISIPTNGEPKRLAESTTLYGRTNADPSFRRARSHVSGDFRVLRSPGVLFGRGGAPSGCLELGGSSAARALSELELEPSPLELRYADVASSVLELPEGLGAKGEA
jgi:hypothetical protein